MKPKQKLPKRDDTINGAFYAKARARLHLNLFYSFTSSINHFELCSHCAIPYIGVKNEFSNYPLIRLSGSTQINKTTKK